MSTRFDEVKGWTKLAVIASWCALAAPLTGCAVEQGDAQNPESVCDEAALAAFDGRGDVAMISVTFVDAEGESVVEEAALRVGESPLVHNVADGRIIKRPRSNDYYYGVELGDEEAMGWQLLTDASRLPEEPLKTSVYTVTCRRRSVGAGFVDVHIEELAAALGRPIQGTPNQTQWLLVMDNLSSMDELEVVIAGDDDLSRLELKVTGAMPSP